jgi:iron complex transport system substrate-binding protein
VSALPVSALPVSALPVSIENKFGTTTVKAEPKRIVAVGLVEQDVLLSLGVVPVATTEWFGVGRKDQAEKVVSDVEGKITTVTTAHPEFAGKTRLMATTYEGYYLYGPQDARGRLLTGLGLKLPDGLAAVTGKDFGANLSKERTDLLNTDVLIWLVDQYPATAVQRAAS